MSVMKGIEMDAMNREEIAAFLESLKKLRDGLDDFNCQLAAIDGAGKRLGLLCQETAAACPDGAAGLAQLFSSAAQVLRGFNDITSQVLTNFLSVADGFARSARTLEIERRKGTH
jgi:hypothetical protein